METVKFTQMKDGDREDYAFLNTHELEYVAGTADRLLTAMVELDKSVSGYKITRLGHSLQAATRAWRDGADIDWVVCALLHDIGDIYAPYNHDEYAATILRPFVREQCAWVVQTHGDFQMVYYAQHVGGNPNKRDAFQGHPYFDDCAEFCEKWDQNSFDPDYETKPLEFFADMVREVFARKAYAPDVMKKGVRVKLSEFSNGGPAQSSIIAMRIILFLLLLCSPAFAAEWTTYANPRFGASVDIPPGFVNDVPASENGDGLVFHSADGQAELLVWGGNLTDGDFKLDSAIRLNRELDYDWQVSYKESGNDWSVYSGSQSGRIMYARAMSSCRGTQAVHFRIEYPEAQKKDYDAIVERLSKSLKAGPAYDCP